VPSGPAGASFQTPRGVPGLGDCAAAALTRSPWAGEVRRRTETKSLRLQEAGMSFGIADSLVAGGQRYANLEITAWKNEVPRLEVFFMWLGTARTVPIGEQRRMAALAREVVAELRAVCLPDVPEAIECVAEGIGGRSACSASPP